MIYVEPIILKEFAVGVEADDSPVWDLLAESASRMFDRACNTEDDFFGKAAAAVSTKTFEATGTRYVKMPPYLPGTITQVKIGDLIQTPLTAYLERDGYLVFNYPVGYRGSVWTYLSAATRPPVAVTARFGFVAVPADVRMAVIEQALLMWRRKDLAFTDLSGVSTSVAQSPYSPTFQIASDKYRGIYAAAVIG